MPSIKCDQCASDISTTAGKCPHGGVRIKPEKNKSGVSKTFKTSIAAAMTVVAALFVLAMLNHSVARLDNPAVTAAIRATDITEHQGGIEILPEQSNRSKKGGRITSAARPEEAIRRVSTGSQGTSNLDPTGLLFDLKRVVDQSPETVSGVLGESPVLWPDDRSVGGVLSGKYKRGKIEIGYAGEAARFITIRLSQCKRWKTSGTDSRRCVEADDFTGYKFRQNLPNLLQALGLPKDQRPSLNDTSVLMWNGASGIHQVSVIPNELGGINYIHVISSRIYACLLERAQVECQPS